MKNLYGNTEKILANETKFVDAVCFPTSLRKQVGM